MEIHKYQVSPSQVTLEESASEVTAPCHDRFFNNESKTRRGRKTYKIVDNSWWEAGDTAHCVKKIMSLTFRIKLYLETQ